ncbi:MAG: phosphoribosylanthranilate isomerase [Alphaproteobacteria bacterium]
MSVASKICGVSDIGAIEAAADGGAEYIGFVFFPRSPRNVTPEQAAALVPQVPDRVEAVALAVDPDDALVDAIGTIPGVSMIQLHGAETPARVAEIRERTGRRAMKAIKVSEAADLDGAVQYFGAADMILFDAKTPADMKNALPGGNAVSFDWTILAGRDWPLPWMLSGGLDPENVAEAIRISGAPAVDVSSGVESAPGVKDPVLIRAFLAAVKEAA